MGRPVKDLTGLRFGRLTVVDRAENSIDGHAKWDCICDCGKTSVVVGTQLRRGDIKSCGCWNQERIRVQNRKSNEFRIEGNQVIVKLSNTDKSMIVDLGTWEHTKKYCWSLSAKGYAIAGDPKSRGTMKFHVIAFPDCPDGMVRDHINGDKLDNRKANIRFVPQELNSQNRGKGKNNTSGHTGVSWQVRYKKWSAYITVNRKRIHLGTFSDRQDAIAAREAAEIKYFGEYRRRK